MAENDVWSYAIRISATISRGVRLATLYTAWQNVRRAKMTAFLNETGDRTRTGGCKAPHTGFPRAVLRTHQSIITCFPFRSWPNYVCALYRLRLGILSAGVRSRLWDLHGCPRGRRCDRCPGGISLPFPISIPSAALRRILALPISINPGKDVPVVFYLVTIPILCRGMARQSPARRHILAISRACIVAVANYVKKHRAF